MAGLTTSLAIALLIKEGAEKLTEMFENKSSSPRKEVRALQRKSAGPEESHRQLTKEENIQLRRAHYGPSCMLYFKQDPLKIDRARGQYMYDERGNRLIDCINNVAHVGHCHPKITEAATKQMNLLYTNNRYLHDNLVLLAKRLTDMLPEGLEVCYFTNSGSEANDLALQIARSYAKQKDVIVLDNAYHGTVSSLQEINPYKWKQCKDPETVSAYKVPWTHVVESPDSYRGKYRDCDYSPDELATLYACEVQKVIETLAKDGKAPAAFIAESMQSCGGQVIFPKGYLKNVKSLMSSCGGLVIADEVQVGFGRVGNHWWAFQEYGPDFVPDIVTMGKPMGNGHPISAVVTTRAIADRFKLPYFNTYGGNPVSCAVALAVLDVIEEDNLRENARRVGAHLLNRLGDLKLRHQVVGDVRGHGLFVGIDLVTDRKTRAPATNLASRLLARMRYSGVLLSSDGPYENIIKFKPPMCITIEDIDEVCNNIEAFLCEVERSST